MKLAELYNISSNDWEKSAQHKSNTNKQQKKITQTVIKYFNFFNHNLAGSKI